MHKTYYQCARRLWLSHSVAPLRASDIALYFLLVHEAYRNEWRMPIHIANGLIVPMLFETGTLALSRKRLVDHGLIEYIKPKSNSHVPSYKIVGVDANDNSDGNNADTNDANSELFVKLVNSVWESFDDMALNASELALYFYVLNLADNAQWQMPVRFRDAAVSPLLMSMSSLNTAREELANRHLITFDLGDPKRNMPKYSIVTDGKIASATTAKHSKKKRSKPVPEPVPEPVPDPTPKPVSQPTSSPIDKHDERNRHGLFDIQNDADSYKGRFT